ncbi:50S ribosomal protein L6 [Amphibacillus sp. Q70]|uniref:50S ribosomal protein L6 n=1 Tax=Amphibacillus sp. Q70 TaxID=3453416 RepID=UPI003F8463CD
MSRIGLKIIEIPEGVEINNDNNFVTVKGPKGQLAQQLHEDMTINIDGKELTVVRPSNSKKNKSLHGTTRSLIANMIEGVHKGFEKSLEIQGVGYRAQKQGNKLVINAGYSHPVEIVQPDGIEFEVPANTKIVVKGIDKELVGALSAKIRAVRNPEPYKGKGIRYEGEYVRRKEGKTAK